MEEHKRAPFAAPEYTPAQEAAERCRELFMQDPLPVDTLIGVIREAENSFDVTEELERFLHDRFMAVECDPRSLQERYRLIRSLNGLSLLAPVLTKEQWELVVSHQGNFRAFFRTDLEATPEERSMVAEFVHKAWLNFSTAAALFPGSLTPPHNPNRLRDF